MQIRKDTWHYKIADWFCENLHYSMFKHGFFGLSIPSDLCRYVRFAILWPSVWVLLWLNVFSSLVYVTIIGPLTGHYRVLMIMLIVATLFAIVGAVSYGIIQLVEAWRRSHQKEKKQKKEKVQKVNIVAEFIKAQHKRICPLLTFVENGEG